MSRIAVLTATRWEFNAVAAAMTQVTPRTVGHFSCLEGRCGANQILLIQTGIGPDAATQGASAVLANSPIDLMVSAGYAGLLTEGQTSRGCHRRHR